MKMLILYMLVLGFFLAGMLMVFENTTWATDFANVQINYLSVDPNEPNEPNEPDPECV